MPSKAQVLEALDEALLETIKQRFLTTTMDVTAPSDLLPGPETPFTRMKRGMKIAKDFHAKVTVAAEEIFTE